jgi:hypothetical protein
MKSATRISAKSPARTLGPGAALGSLGIGKLDRHEIFRRSLTCSCDEIGQVRVAAVVISKVSSPGGKNHWIVNMAKFP